MGASAEVIHEPEHRLPAYHRHGCKLLPVHRIAAAHVPLRGGSNGQGKEFPVQIHRRAGQVDLGLQGKMYSTSTQASHTTSSGLTDRKNTFVGHSSRQSNFGERGNRAPKRDVL